MDTRSARAGVAIVAFAFLAYWCLLVYCDVWRPVTPGFLVSFETGTMMLLDVAAGTPAGRAGLRPGDRIVAIDGHPVGSRLDWMAIEANLELDRSSVFTVSRNGSRSTVLVTTPLASWQAWRSQDGPLLLVIRSMQLASLLVAALVALKRPRDPAALVGAGFLATIGVFSVTLPYRLATVWHTLPVALSAWFWLPFTSSLAMAVWAYSFFGVFPRPRFRSPLAWCALWVPIVPGLIGHVVYGYHMIVRGQPDPQTIPHWPELLSIASGIYVVALAVAVARTYQRTRDLTERRRLRVLMVGTLVGACGGVPVLLSYWRGSTTDLNRSFLASPLATPGTLLFLVLPLSFAYAILRHRLFDIRVMIRQGVRYALARRALLALVPLLVTMMLVDLLAHADQPIGDVVRTRVLLYASLAALIVLARARRELWLDALDRRFFRERYSAQRVLRQVAEDVRRASSFPAVAPTVVSRIEQALHPTFVALLVREHGGQRYRTLVASPSHESPEPLDSANKVLALARLLGRPLDLIGSEAQWLAHKMPIGDVQTIRAAGIELLVPVAAGPDEANAVLALGSKRSEEPYTEDDGELLMAVAESVALRVPAADVPSTADTERFGECPTCGACYKVGTTRCPVEGMMLVPILAPRVVAARYHIEHRLGRGGMGTVYEAFDAALERRVAVKLMRPDLIGNPGAAERFQREARTAAAFSHPNVVTVHDFGVAGTNAFLVMELLQGQSLDDALRIEHRMDPARAVAILRDVTSAVEAAHRRQLVHRDLKPENIYLVRREGGETAKVLDFGIAKLLASGDLDLRTAQVTGGALLGTPLYMAPEQLRGEEPSPVWDVWALAVVAFEMLTGSHPFASTGAGSIRAAGSPSVASLPQVCSEFFGRALSVNPADRPTSARRFLDDLESSLLS